MRGTCENGVLFESHSESRADMRLRKARKTWKSQIEALELRALLSGDGVCPPDLPPDPPVEEPVISGPMEPITPALFESEVGEFPDTLEDALGIQPEPGFIQMAFGSVGDSDRDVFVVRAAGEVFNVEAHPEPDTGLPLKLSVLDADGETITSVESIVLPADVPLFLPAAARFELESDVAFLVVESADGTVGDYVLNVNLEIELDEPEPIEFEIPVDAELGDDIHSGSFDDSATLLTFEDGFANVASNIDRDADSDVFRFVATEANINVDAFGELPLVLNIHDAEGNVVSEADLFFPDEGELFFAFNSAETVPGDTYFVSVVSTKGRVGSYELNVNAFAPPPPPPTPDRRWEKTSTVTRLSPRRRSISQMDFLV